MQVTDIWRYPVKSVPGLRVASAEIGAYGIVGDRQYALRDCATALVLTARREPKLLTVAALPSDDADGGVGHPPLPDQPAHRRRR